MAKPKTETERREKLVDLIKDIQFCMLTTVSEDGRLHSRPMAVCEVDPQGNELWFFTRADSLKVSETQRDRDVNVAFADPDSNIYVSMSGRAQLVRDRQKMQDLWSTPLKTWFPKGLDDPEIALLNISVSNAEYWDQPSSTMIHLYGLAKATLTGKPPQPGEHETVNYSRTV